MFDFNNNGEFDAFDALMINELIEEDKSESKKFSKKDSLDSDVPVRRYSDDSDDSDVPVRRYSDDSDDSDNSDDIDISAADTFDIGFMSYLYKLPTLTRYELYVPADLEVLN